MGGANSRLNVAEARGGIARRFEELRKSSGKEEGTLSKKQLLNDSNSNEGGDTSSSLGTDAGDKVLQNDQNQTSKEEKKDMNQPSNEENKDNNQTSKEEKKDKEQGKDSVIKGNNNAVDNHNNHEQKHEIHVDEKPQNKTKQEKPQNEPKVEKPRNEPKVDAKSGDNYNDNDKDSDDDESEEDGGLICPGSPSFKIYYIEAEEKKEDEEEEECKKEKKKKTIPPKHKKSHSAACVEGAVTGESGTLNEVPLPHAVESEPTTKRKEHRLKKFGARQTLLKVKSFYQPMCTCTGNDRSHLVMSKEAN